ncbi:MAG TPA: hypothetical protein VIE16_06405 [Phenylobacterium sp.]
MVLHTGSRGPGHMSPVAGKVSIGVPSSNSPSPGARFNRDTIIKAPRLGVANSTQMVVFWSMFGTAYTGAAIQDGFAGVPCMQSDPNTNGEVTGGVSPGICSPAFENTGIGQLNFNTAAGATVGVDDIKFELAAPNTAWFTAGRWNSYLLTWDSATGDWAGYWADGSQADMTDLRALGVLTAASLPTNALCDLNNVNGLMIGASTFSQGPGANGALDSIYICAGEALCDGSGAVTPANLRKFYAAGKVQDLTTFPTGRRPAVLVTFDPATGAVINSGAGAAFSVASSLFSGTVSSSQGFSGQENPRLERFPWGPGQDEPAAPHYRFTIEDGGLGIVTQTNATQVLQPNGFPIAAGDILIFGASIQDRNGAFNHNITLPDPLKTAVGASQPNGWTSATGGNVYPGADMVAFNGGVKVADAADVRMADSYAGRDATLLATSTSSVTIPGAPALPNSGAAFDMTIQAGKGFVAGDVVEVWGANAVNDRANRFWASVNSYAGTTLNLTPICSQGSVAGYSHWTINLGGWKWNWTMSGGAGSAPGDKLQCGQAFMHVYGGASGVGAVGHANSTAWAGSTSIATGGVTTTHANALVVSCWLTADAGPHAAPHAGAGYVERYKTLKRDRAASAGTFCALADEVKTSPGAYASQLMDIKATDGSSAWNGFVCGFNVELVP